MNTLRLVGTPILPMPEARSWTFYRVWGKITESSTRRVWKEGEYWTAYGSMIDKDFEYYIDQYGREHTEYEWEYEIREECRGIPAGYIYSTMNVG